MIWYVECDVVLMGLAAVSDHLGVSLNFAFQWGSLLRHSDSLCDGQVCHTSSGFCCQCCRHNERARSFLGMLRQSQMYEVFIQERLKMLATVKGGPEFSGKRVCISYMLKRLGTSHANVQRQLAAGCLKSWELT